MPNIRKIITCCLLLYVSHCFFNKAAAQPFFTEEKPLHSTINGKEIAKLTFSVEQKKPDEYILTIENKQNSSTTEIWIFHKNATASKGKLSGYPWEVEGVNSVLPFCSGGAVNVPLTETKNVRSKETLSLSGALAEGKTVTLNMNFYIVSKSKKKTVLNNYAKVNLTFTIPDAKSAGKSRRPKDPKSPQGGDDDKPVTTLAIDTDLAPPPSDPQTATPDEIEEARQRKTDSLLQIQIADLDAFISEKNLAIEDQLAKINELLETRSEKVEESLITPIEKEIKRLQKNVGFRENTPAIAENESLRDKFSEFSLMYEEAEDGIRQLRQEPPKPEPINWALYIGLALGGFMVIGMFGMQIFNQIKIKRQQRRQQKAMEQEMEKQKRSNEFTFTDEPLEDI
ncbi:MAG: hypothetical protein FWG84_06755 [Bacteroidales bacterium]|nr:hypothetical protein [Bacteroidales bacterium]